MPQSLANITIHLVFSTKNRKPYLVKVLQPNTHAYLAGILQSLGCYAIEIGGVEDHVHLLFRLSRTVTVAHVVENVKKGSSKWLKTKGVPEFSWQAGYGAFSIGRSEVEGAITYIRGHEGHHKKVSFQEEFRKLLEEFEVTYDERYVWD